MMIQIIGNLKFENKIIGFLLMDEKGNIKIKITNIAGLYSHQNARNDKRIEELIEKGIDLEKEYEKIMNKSIQA